MLPVLGLAFVVAGGIALALRFVGNATLATNDIGPLAKPHATKQLSWVSQASTLVFVLGAAPVIAVTLFVVATALRHSPVLGPNPDSIFARMGLATSYAAPVLIAAATMIGYAIRERSSRFAFAGGLVLCFGVS